MRAFVLCALLTFALPHSAFATTSFRPKVLVDKTVRSDCEFSMWNSEDKSSAQSGVGFVGHVRAGRYDVRVRCPTDAGPLAVVLSDVRITADRENTPTLAITSARLRVMAKRDGSIKAAEVRLFAPGDVLHEPLFTHAANDKFVVAEGRYDVEVLLKSGGGTSARFRNVQVKGPGVTSFDADLSDGEVVVSIFENGKKADGIVRIFAQGASAALTQAAGEEAISLPPGLYEIESTLAASADFQSRRQSQWIEPQKRIKLTEHFSSGSLRVDVVRGGAPLSATVQLALAGAAEFFNYFSAPGPAVLSPGTYDVTVQLSSESEESKSESSAVFPQKQTGVVIKKAQTTKLRFDVTPALVVIQVVRAGKPVELEEVKLLIAGSDREAAKPNFDGEYQIAPGRYEIVAKLVNGDVAKDGPFSVNFGQKLVRTVELPHGTLSIRFKAPRPKAEISVFRPGAAKPTARIEGGGLVVLAPGTYDLKIVDGPHTEWREGVRILERKNTEIVIEPPKTTAAGTEDPELPEGDDPEK